MSKLTYTLTTLAALAVGAGVGAAAVYFPFSDDLGRVSQLEGDCQRELKGKKENLSKTQAELAESRRLNLRIWDMDADVTDCSQREEALQDNLASCLANRVSPSNPQGNGPFPDPEESIHPLLESVLNGHYLSIVSVEQPAVPDVPNDGEQGIATGARYHLNLSGEATNARGVYSWGQKSFLFSTGDGSYSLDSVELTAKTDKVPDCENRGIYCDSITGVGFKGNGSMLAWDEVETVIVYRGKANEQLPANHELVASTYRSIFEGLVESIETEADNRLERIIQPPTLTGTGGIGTP
ncbi:hypothetical protein HYX12_03850 [Candidatus Woesearchaeota archaeon]|nr:hypothetical protein [Candidatus Woesearchaeota archaeon]